MEQRQIQGVQQRPLTLSNVMQVMSVATVGNDQDGLTSDTVHGPESKRFMAHFTCPSFAVNEVRYPMHCHLLATCLLNAMCSASGVFCSIKFQASRLMGNLDAWRCEVDNSVFECCQRHVHQSVSPQHTAQQSCACMF